VILGLTLFGPPQVDEHREAVCSLSASIAQLLTMFDANAAGSGPRDGPMHIRMQHVGIWSPPISSLERTMIAVSGHTAPLSPSFRMLNIAIPMSVSANAGPARQRELPRKARMRIWSTSASRCGACMTASSCSTTG